MATVVECTGLHSPHGSWPPWWDAQVYTDHGDGAQDQAHQPSDVEAGRGERPLLGSAAGFQNQRQWPPLASPHTWPAEGRAQAGRAAGAGEQEPVRTSACCRGALAGAAGDYGRQACSSRGAQGLRLLDSFRADPSSGTAAPPLSSSLPQVRVLCCFLSLNALRGAERAPVCAVKSCGNQAPARKGFPCAQ